MITAQLTSVLSTVAALDDGCLDGARLVDGARHGITLDRSVPELLVVDVASRGGLPVCYHLWGFETVHAVGDGVTLVLELAVERVTVDSFVIGVESGLVNEATTRIS